MYKMLIIKRNIWELEEENAKGQVIREKKGNKETTYTYYDTGFPKFVYASGVIDNLYRFDERGNQIYRDEYAVLSPQEEDLDYDTQNRLTNWIGGSIAYNDTTGNIQSKTDLGSFVFNYGENDYPPHALTSISGVPDNFPVNDLNVTYTDFKKIKTLTEGNKNYTLMYGVDDQRRKSVYKESNAAKETRYYMGDYEEKIDHVSGVIEKIHYLSEAVYIERSNGTSNFYHTYTDIIGSLTALVNENGTITERYAYDPWCKRRNPNNWAQTDTRTSWIINRGYTGHEHLDWFGIINMNGRVYDPLTVMFFSPDPFVQEPGNWLNYNRYGYCLNNPFRYTDPDGEVIFTILAAIFCPPLLPVAIVADAAWMSNYASQVANNYANGYKGTEAFFGQVDWFDVGMSAVFGGASVYAPWIKYVEPWVTNAVDIRGNGNVETIFGSNRNNPTKDLGMYLGDSFLESSSILITDIFQEAADNNWGKGKPKNAPKSIPLSISNTL
jgi:RHS repeat-associated protein